ncbi:hypothetical protein [Bdellovibrio sp. HCB337]|uniref:hypothetical protein n=1 Tax=Bdellovibrio sp. HCB337 TaxID=3394358 RepID=UPI0039A75134
MKPNASYPRIATAFLTFFVVCQSFGQGLAARSNALPSVNSFEKGLGKLKQATELSDALIIDFTKVDLNNLQENSIKVEKREGPSSGGGGNTCALMLKQNAIELLARIKDYPLFQKDSVAAILESKIKAAKFQAGENLYIEGRDIYFKGRTIHIDAKKVEAINYPDKNTIVIEQSFCDNVSTLSIASLGTTLHEYLGLALLDDTKYQISGPFVKSIYQAEYAKKSKNASFSDIQVNNLRMKFQNSKPVVVDDIEIKTFDSTCTYFGEIEGKSISQKFSLQRSSEQNMLMEHDTLGSLNLKMLQYMVGIYITLPSENSTSSSYMILREYAPGIYIGEWNIVGNELVDTLRLEKGNYPVASTSVGGSLSTGYSVCSPK